MSKPSLSDLMYQTLLERITKCQYLPGSLLSEEQLVSELNASRTPIRSALIRLQQDNLVRIIPKRGVLVTEITPDSVRDLFNLRELIEPYAVVNYGDNFRKDRLLYYLDLFSKSYDKIDQNQVFDSDVAFHSEIVDLAGNALLSSYYDSMQKHLARISSICGISDIHRVADSNCEHVDIILSLLRDDAEAATAQLRAHLKKARSSAYQAIIQQPTHSNC